MYMNIPPPMTKKNYGKLNGVMCAAYSTIAEASIRRAGVEVHNEINKRSSDDVTDCQGSVDGTWQSEGYHP